MAVEQDHPKAMHLLGYAHSEGRGVGKNRSKAIEWYRRSAELGYHRAQYHLAVAYNTGRGVPEDLGLFSEWARMAADQGNAGGQFLLGFAYQQGRGVKKDAALSALWYRRAAQQGHVRAQYRLALANAHGRGVPVDRIESYKWAAVAHGNQHRRAQALLDRLDGAMSSSDVARGGAKARAWTPSPSGAFPDQAIVRFVQHALGRLGFSSGHVDGAAGPATRAAVRAFQRSMKLPENGVIDLALVEIVDTDRL